MKKDRITKFLNKYTYEQPKVVKTASIQDFNAKTYKAGLCAKKSSNFCLLIFSPAVKTSIESILNLYDNDPVSFAFVDKTTEPGIYKLFGKPESDVAVLKPKR